MKCVYCYHTKTHVTNSREIKKGIGTWRRRQCLLCRDTFTTKESAFADNLFIIKRNKSRERLIYEKLFISIFVSLNTKKGGDNGTNALLAKKITERIIQKVLMLPAAHSNVPTSLLISLVYSELRKIGKSFADHYMYYSEYRQQVARKMGLI